MPNATLHFLASQFKYKFYYFFYSVQHLIMFMKVSQGYVFLHKHILQYFLCPHCYSYLYAFSLSQTHTGPKPSSVYQIWIIGFCFTLLLDYSGGELHSAALVFLPFSFAMKHFLIPFTCQIFEGETGLNCQKNRFGRCISTLCCQMFDTDSPHRDGLQISILKHPWQRTSHCLQVSAFPHQNCTVSN